MNTLFGVAADAGVLIVTAVVRVQEGAVQEIVLGAVALDVVQLDRTGALAKVSEVERLGSCKLVTRLSVKLDSARTTQPHPVPRCIRD